MLVALVNLMFNGEHRLSFKNGVKFFFLCVSFVVVLLSCGAWHLGLTLYKLTRGPLMTVCLAFVFSGVILLSAQNQEVVELEKMVSRGLCLRTVVNLASNAHGPGAAAELPFLVFDPCVVYLSSTGR